MAEAGLEEKAAWEQHFEGLRPDPAWSFAHLTQKDTTYATHGYHRYPAKFIPQVAAALIETYSQKGQVVLDPFMGSGTTLVEAKRSGRPSMGIDINPVAHLIALAKVQAIEPKRLAKAIRHLHSVLFPVRELSLFSSSTSEASGIWPERLRYWFREEVLAALRTIQNSIHTLEPEMQPFFACALSHSLKSLSYWHDRSIKPTRKLDKPIPDSYETFFRQVRRMERGNSEYWDILVQADTQEVPATPLCADARALPLPDQSVELIVTSPPYVTSYEYADLHQLSALWFEMTSDLRTFRKSFIGRSHILQTEEKPLCSPLADRIVAALARQDVKKSQEARQYFVDMYACFLEWQRVLKHGGYACIVIGNTHLLGVEIQNSQVFVEQLWTLGLELKKVILREIPGKILPRTRDKKTGRFAKSQAADYMAYPTEYILVFSR